MANRARLVALIVGITAASGCGAVADDLFCDDAGCGFSDLAWSRLSALANLGDPPVDRSSGVSGNVDAQILGRSFFNDPRFSGPATQVDALGRPAAVARAPLGQPTNLACASCHDLGRMGVDVASVPGNTSSGAGWTDVNALAIVNAAYQRLYFWNGRADSLWSLAFLVAESRTTMNGNRLQIAHVIADSYRDQYDRVFAPLGQPMPIPPEDSVCAISKVLIQTGPAAGQCTTCAAPCRPVNDANGTFVGCFPRFPLQGKPGSAGCQPGKAGEPFGDAFDCMDAADGAAVTQVLANWGMALEAFEALLTNHEDTPFDAWIAAGPRSKFDASARRGAQLFVGKAGCVDCHDTPLFSDGQFHDVGVAQVGPNVPTLADCRSGAPCDCVAGKKCLPWGRYDGLTRVPLEDTTRTGPLSHDRLDTSRVADLGEAPTAAMKGAWRTPTLRNAAETAPYMHDGRYATLEEVVEHYDRGGDPDAVGTVDVRIRPLGLTDAEKADLVAFLRTLSGSALAPPLPKEQPLPLTPVCP